MYYLLYNASVYGLFFHVQVSNVPPLIASQFTILGLRSKSRIKRIAIYV